MSLHRRLFFFLLILLPTQLGLHFWPIWTMVLGRRIDYLSPTIYVTDILLLGVLVAGTREFFRAKRSQARILKHYPKQHLAFFLPLFLFAAVNLLMAQAREVSLYNWVKVVEYTCFSWYIIYSKPSRTLVVSALSIGLLIVSCIGLVQFGLQRSVGGATWLLGERTFSLSTPGIARFAVCFPLPSSCHVWLRSYGTLPHPNVLGGYVVVVLSLITGEYLRTKDFKWRLFYLCAVILGVSVLLTSFSRSAWFVGGVALGVASSVSLWHTRGTQRTHRDVFAICAGLFTVALILLAVVFRPSVTDESITVRAQLNSSAFALWGSSPLFGVGLGNFLIRLPSVTKSHTQFFIQPAHNIYLLLLAETGLVGLIGSIWFMVISLYRSRATYVIACGALLVLGLVDHYPLTLQQGQLLFVLLFSLAYTSHNS